MHTLYPLKFTPILKDKIWGGSKLSTLFNKESHSGKLGESWELSGYDDDVSVVSNGSLTGQNLNQLISEYKDKLVGNAVYEKFGNTFPLLFKLIDANDYLSIQVHPDDEVAMDRHQGFGKTEMWYVVDSEDDGELIIGFKEDYSKETYLQALHEGKIEELLQSVKVKKGDVFFVPAGLVHAIGKGVVVAEIQQTSDLTYRIYDYQRKDAEGKERELHTDLALDVIDFSATSDPKTVYSSTLNELETLVSCEYFTTNIVQFNEQMNRYYGKVDSFVVYMCMEGEFEIVSDDMRVQVVKGETVMIPAELESVVLEPAGQVTILEVYIA